MSELYNYQLECVNFSIRHRYTINACEPGLGKTRMALEVIKRTGLKALVVGPAFLEGTWVNEGIKYGVTDFLYVPYSKIHKYSANTLMDRRVWVADECHYLKSPTAIRTAAYYALLKQVRCDYWLGMSGTPIKGKIPDLWTLLAICSQVPEPVNGLKLEGDLTKYRKFSEYFTNKITMKVRGRWIEKFEGVNEKRLPELRELLRDKYIRFLVKDILQDLPTMTTIEVPANLREVEGLKEMFEAYLAGSKVDPTAKASSAMLKTHATIEYVSNLLDAEEQVLVFSDHVAPVHEIAKGLRIGDKVRSITGATPAAERQKIAEAFQRGDVKVIVATIGALATGVTLTAARHVVFSDLSWVPSDNLQASKRVHRIGQKSACFRHVMIASPTDAYIAKTLVAKEETIMRVIGD